MRSVDAVNPAVSTTAPAPTAMPAGFTSTSRPLELSVPKMALGFVAHYPVDGRAVGAGLVELRKRARRHRETLPVQRTVAAACAVGGGDDGLVAPGWRHWRMPWMYLKPAGWARAPDENGRHGQRSGGRRKPAPPGSTTGRKGRDGIARGSSPAESALDSRAFRCGWDWQRA